MLYLRNGKFLACTKHSVLNLEPISENVLRMELSKSNLPGIADSVVVQIKNNGDEDLIDIMGAIRKEHGVDKMIELLKENGYSEEDVDIIRTSTEG